MKKLVLKNISDYLMMMIKELIISVVHRNCAGGELSWNLIFVTADRLSGETLSKCDAASWRNVAQGSDLYTCNGRLNSGTPPLVVRFPRLANLSAVSFLCAACKCLKAYWKACVKSKRELFSGDLQSDETVCYVIYVQPKREAGEDCIMRSFITCTLQHTLLG